MPNEACTLAAHLLRSNCVKTNASLKMNHTIKYILLCSYWSFLFQCQRIFNVRIVCTSLFYTVLSLSHSRNLSHNLKCHNCFKTVSYPSASQRTHCTFCANYDTVLSQKNTWHTENNDTTKKKRTVCIPCLNDVLNNTTIRQTSYWMQIKPFSVKISKFALMTVPA